MFTIFLSKITFFILKTADRAVLNKIFRFWLQFKISWSCDQFSEIKWRQTDIYYSEYQKQPGYPW